MLIERWRWKSNLRGSVVTDVETFWGTLRVRHLTGRMSNRYGMTRPHSRYVLHLRMGRVAHIQTTSTINVNMLIRHLKPSLQWKGCFGTNQYSIIILVWVLDLQSLVPLLMHQHLIRSCWVISSSQYLIFNPLIYFLLFKILIKYESP